MKNVLIATNFDCGKYVLIDANLIKKNLSRSTFAFEKLLKYILQIRSQSSFFFHLELFTINIFVFFLFLVSFFFLIMLLHRPLLLSPYCWIYGSLLFGASMA